MITTYYQWCFSNKCGACISFTLLILSITLMWSSPSQAAKSTKLKTHGIDLKQMGFFLETWKDILEDAGGAFFSYFLDPPWCYGEMCWRKYLQSEDVWLKVWNLENDAILVLDWAYVPPSFKKLHLGVFPLNRKLDQSDTQKILQRKIRKHLGQNVD